MTSKIKKRIDKLLRERGLAKSRTKAQELIKEGKVKVEGEKIEKKSKKVPIDVNIQLKKKYPYVSKGGFKLDKALKKFNVNFEDKVVMDIGSSTGGFTDRLLKAGAKKVYCVEISKKPLLAKKLRKREEVIEMKGQDIRELEELPEKVDGCTIDVTFTSIREVLPQTRKLMKKEGDIIALIKPPFESEERRKEEVKNLPEKQMKKRMGNVKKWCKENGFRIEGTVEAPFSKEYLFHIKIKE